MKLRLEVARLGVEVSGPELILQALRGRFSAFVADGPADVRLEIAEVSGDFEPDLRLDLDLRVEATPGERGILMRGAAAGGYDPRTRCGWLDAPRNLGEIDGLIRLALSVELPRRGALLLHAAAVLQRDKAVVLAGSSGAGKSTAARELGQALSDELTVVAADGVFGTPYWNGRAEHAPLAEIVLLERGQAGPPEPLSGGRAVAALAPHVIRYVADESLDREVLALVAKQCERSRPICLRCPEGAAFLPHLREALR